MVLAVLRFGIASFLRYALTVDTEQISFASKSSTSIMFSSIVAASPSVWFPKWIEYASDNKPLANTIYLSLGDKEEKTKNQVMAQVGNAIRRQNELLTGQIDNTILEWNPGNHFIDSEKRTAKGFAWVMD